PLAVLPAVAQQAILPHSFGLRANSADDQTAQFLEACSAAAEAGLALFLPAGVYLIGSVDLPGGLLLTGIAGRSILRLPEAGGVVRIADTQNITLDGIALEGAFSSVAAAEGVLAISGSSDIDIIRC